MNECAINLALTTLGRPETDGKIMRVWTTAHGGSAEFGGRASQDRFVIRSASFFGRPYEQTDLKGDRQIRAASNNPEYDCTEMAFFFSFAARRATLISDP